MKKIVCRFLNLFYIGKNEKSKIISTKNSVEKTTVDPVLEDHVGMVDHPVDLANEHVRQVIQQQIGHPTSTELNYLFLKKKIFYHKFKKFKILQSCMGAPPYMIVGGYNKLAQKLFQQNFSSQLLLTDESTVPVYGISMLYYEPWILTFLKSKTLRNSVNFQYSY
jgi:hypothetical protein